MKLSSLTRAAWIASGLLLVIATLSGFGCKREATRGEQLDRSLIVWGLWQESADMQAVVDAFEQQTGVAVEYKKVASVGNYEKELLVALAEGRGPDVFVIHHTWVEGKRGILSAAPAAVVDERAVREEFVDVAATDLVRDGSVYALPTSVDTLALYYNKDVLNAAGVPRPPDDWEELQRVVEKITKVTRIGTLDQSAIAIGAAANVNRAADILQLLMMQSSLPLRASSGRVEIASDIGERALIFYTDFANKAKKVYTWNLQQDFSLDAFAAGKTAMMINYSYHIPTVRAKNPRLNFGIAKLPRIPDSSTTLNFASYWPFAVSVSSPSPQLAWQFVRLLTSQPMATPVNAAQGVPPARKDSVIELQRDPLLGVFADQALTATSWARDDIASTDSIFNTMIDSVVQGETAPGEALRRAEDQLNQLGQDDVGS